MAIRRIDVGWAMEAGLCILLMAIMFDRFSASFNNASKLALSKDRVRFHLLPQNWDQSFVALFIEKVIRQVHRATSTFFLYFTLVLSEFLKH